MVSRSRTTQPAHEISRAPPIVSECNNFEAIGKISENDVVWKCVNGHAANAPIFDVRNAAADLREVLDQLECPARLRLEPIGHAWISVSVPAQRFTELELRGLGDLERLQRLRTSL
jgi:hypothetical protein